MNFLDTYDISTSSAGTSTPPPAQNQQTLNEEVNQVIGQLGRFWGGFRKQSQSVFETARRDIGDVVNQAQKELTRLASNTTEEPNVEREIQSSSSSREYEEEATSLSASVSTIRDTSSTDAPTSSSADPSSHTGAQPQSGWNTQTLFSRLQSALPPNVVATVQNHIPESIKHASENVDLTQIRTNLLSEVQRIQGVTRAQAEEYVHKSEALLREAVKEAQEVFKDAVKVIPPEDSGATTTSTTSGLIWDGADMWTLPGVVESNSDAADADSSSGKGKGKNIDSGAAAVATRAEALLRRLKHDPAIVRMDPGVDETTKDKYMAWIKREVVSKEGGIKGEEWRETVSKNLDDSVDGEALTNLKAMLVPSELTEQEFWQRFFFRAHQIKEEEEKRKALLQANTESEDEFNWDDEDSEDDEETSKQQVAKEATPTQERKLTTPASEPGTAPPSSTISTRESSLDSFDVVSSANASVSGDPRTQHAKATEADDDDDDDDDEDEDEDEDDSDWE